MSGRVIIVLLGCVSFLLGTEWGLGWLLGNGLMLVFVNNKQSSLRRITLVTHSIEQGHLCYALIWFLVFTLPFLLAYDNADILQPVSLCLGALNQYAFGYVLYLNRRRDYRDY